MAVSQGFPEPAAGCVCGCVCTSDRRAQWHCHHQEITNNRIVSEVRQGLRILTETNRAWREIAQARQHAWTQTGARHLGAQMHPASTYGGPDTHPPRADMCTRISTCRVPRHTGTQLRLSPARVWRPCYWNKGGWSLQAEDSLLGISSRGNTPPLQSLSRFVFKAVSSSPLARNLGVSAPGRRWRTDLRMLNILWAGQGLWSDGVKRQQWAGRQRMNLLSPSLFLFWDPLSPARRGHLVVLHRWLVYNFRAISGCPHMVYIPHLPTSQRLKPKFITVQPTGYFLTRQNCPPQHVYPSLTAPVPTNFSPFLQVHQVSEPLCKLPLL